SGTVDFPTPIGVRNSKRFANFRFQRETRGSCLAAFAISAELAVLDENVDAIGIACSPIPQIRPTKCHRLRRIGRRLC
ncbi:hypothetical protein, partial [Erythrobacter sp. CCH5-A1]